MSELAGRTVLVTRPADEATEVVGLLQAQGARVLLQPTVEYVPPTDPGPLLAALGQLESFSWIAFTSARAVRVLDPAVPLGRLRLAAVGLQTARAIEERGLAVSLVASGGNARSLASEFSACLGPGDRVLYLRAEQVNFDLALALRATGAMVDEAVAYRIQLPLGGFPRVAEALTKGTLDWITAFSGSALRNLQQALLEPDLLLRARLATVGPATSRVAASLGLVVHTEAARPDAAGLVAAILACQRGSAG